MGIRGSGMDSATSCLESNPGEGVIVAGPRPVGITLVSNGHGSSTRVLGPDGRDITRELRLKTIKVVIDAARPNQAVLEPSLPKLSLKVFSGEEVVSAVFTEALSASTCDLLQQALDRRRQELSDEAPPADPAPLAIDQGASR